MWNLLGAAVCAEADCDIGSSTALWLAAAAGDRAGSLDSNSIIISPFKSSAFLHDYAQQWNLKPSTAGDSLRVRSRSHSYPSLSVFFSPSLSVISVKSVYPLPSPPPPPPLSPSTQGFGQEPATSLRQIFPGSLKAILPGFPLDLYPLPMFQIIYRRIYLFYVVMNSFDMPILNETLLLTCIYPRMNHLLYFVYLVWFLSVTVSEYAPNHSHIMLSVTVQYCTMQRWWSIVSVLQEKQGWCNCVVILDWQIDSGRPSERGREWNGIADKLLWPLGSFGLQSARHIQCLLQVSSSMNMLLPHGEKAYCAHQQNHQHQ